MLWQQNLAGCPKFFRRPRKGWGIGYKPCPLPWSQPSTELASLEAILPMGGRIKSKTSPALLSSEPSQLLPSLLLEAGPGTLLLTARPSGLSQARTLHPSCHPRRGVQRKRFSEATCALLFQSINGHPLAPRP